MAGLLHNITLETEEQVKSFFNALDQSKQATIGASDRVRIETDALLHYGRSAQIRQAVEEMAELTQALCKYERAQGEPSDEVMSNLREEIADVTIMLEQLKLLFGSTTDFEEFKLRRLKSRIKNERNPE